MLTRLTIAYRGTGYAGWQRQTNALAVQQVVEEALGGLLATPVRLQAAGRTDAGVHARGQEAHWTLDRDFSLKGLVHGTNHQLPDDIRLLAAARMGEGFHARKSAVAKTYRYRLFPGRVPSPLDADQVVAVPKLDLEAIRRALADLPGRHDWTAFAAAGGSHTQPYRRLFAAWLEVYPRELQLVFVGEGFLRGMVRALVGTLLEVGRGRRPADDMPRLLAGVARNQAGATAPAHGLVLERVAYGPRWQPLDIYRARAD